MPELVHAWAETLDGQVSRGRCGIVTLTYLFSRDGKETCPRCRIVAQMPAPSPSLTDAQLHALARAHTGIVVNGVWDTSREPQPGPEPIQTPEVAPSEAERRIALLRACIAKSGMSNSAYARDVLVRAPRSVRRWLAGDAPIPQQVLAFLEKGG